MATVIRRTAIVTLLLWSMGIMPTANVFEVEPIAVAVAQAPHDDAAAGTEPDAASGDSDAHGDGHATPGLLDPQVGPFIWQTILFLLLLAVLAKFVWPPILKGLQDRENKIRGDLEHAEKAAKDATSTLEEYRVQLAQAQQKAQQVIDQSRGEAQKVAAQVKEQTQAEITQMRERAESEISGAKEQALAEIYQQTAILATQVAGQILRRQINADDQRDLVEQSLRKLTEGNRN